jgi:hypothetical protein
MFVVLYTVCCLLCCTLYIDDCPPLGLPGYSSGDDTDEEDASEEEDVSTDVSTLLPTSVEWGLARELEATLNPAYEVTNYLEGEKYCTIDRAWPMLATLLKRYKDDTMLQVRRAVYY